MTAEESDVTFQMENMSLVSQCKVNPGRTSNPCYKGLYRSTLIRKFYDANVRTTARALTNNVQIVDVRDGNLRRLLERFSKHDAT